MRKVLSRLLVALLIMTMCVTLTPTQIFAVDGVGDNDTTTNVSEPIGDSDNSTNDQNDETGTNDPADVTDDSNQNNTGNGNSDANQTGEQTPATLSDDTGKDPAGGGNGSYDGATYEYSVHWNNANTADYNIDEDGNLIIHTVDNERKTAILEFEFKIQQTDEQTLPVGAVEFKIPKVIFERRASDGGEDKKYCADDDSDKQLIMTGISEAPASSSDCDFNYVDEGEYIALKNYMAFSGPKTLTVEVSYEFRPTRVAGGNLESGTYGKSDAVYGGDYFEKTIDVPVKVDIDMDGNPEIAKTEQLSLEVHTNMNPVTIEKAPNNDSNGGVYFRWQDSWGNKPADADDYFYVIWDNKLKRPSKSSQPFDVVVGEDAETLEANQGEFIGALGTETNNKAGELWCNGYYGDRYCYVDANYTGIADEGWEDRLSFYGYENKNPTETSHWLRDKHPTGGNYAYYRHVYYLTRYPMSLIEEAEANGVDMSLEGITVTNKSFVTSTAYEGKTVTNTSNAASALIIKKPAGAGGTFDKNIPFWTYYAAVKGGGTRLLQNKNVAIQGNTGDNNTEYSYYITGSAYSLSGYSDDGVAIKPYTISMEDGDAYLSELYKGNDDGQTTSQFMTNSNKQVFSKLDESDTAKALHNPVKLDETATTFGYLAITLDEYEGQNAGGSWVEAAGSSEKYDQIKPVYIYIHENGGAEKLYATLQYETNLLGNTKWVCRDANGDVLIKEVTSSTKIELPDNTTNFRVAHESSFYHCEMKVSFRETLKATEQVKNIIKGYQDDSNVAMGYFTNIGKYSISDGTNSQVTDDIKITSQPGANGKRLGEINRRSYRLPFIEPYTTITKVQGTASGDLKDNAEDGTQSRKVIIRVRNYSTIGGSFSDKEILANSGTAIRSGVYYDLLPAGTEVDLASIKVGVCEEGTTVTKALPAENYTVTFIERYNDSNRTMMIVKYTLPDDKEYTGALHRALQYNLINTYSNIKDRGADVRNTVAHVNTDPDTPSNVPKDYQISAIKDSDIMAPVEEDFGSNACYTEATINYNALRVLETGFSKKVRSDSSPKYDVKSDAYLGDGYTYKIAFTNEKRTVSDSIILWDIVDNAEGSEWQGAIDYIDIDSIKSKLTKGSTTVTCDPQVYYTTTLPTSADIDLEDGTWIKSADQSVPADAKAFAVDCRKATDGSDFRLGYGMTLAVEIGMIAPEDKSLVGKTAKNIAHINRRSFDTEPTPSDKIIGMYSTTEITLHDAELEFHKEALYDSKWDNGTADSPVEVANNANEQIAYKLKVTNNSDVLRYKNIVIEDPIPEGLTIDNSKTTVDLLDADGKSQYVTGKVTTAPLVSSRADYTSKADGQNMTLTISALKPGETVEFMIYTTQDKPVVKSTDYINQATITKINNHDEDIDSEITYHHVTQLYTLTYHIEDYGSKIPADVDTPDPVTGIEYDTDEDLEVRDTNLATRPEIRGTETLDIPGTWTFTGWYSTSAEAKAAYDAIVAGETPEVPLDIKNIKQDEDVYGGFIFVPDTYELKYVVQGDPTWGLPTDSVTPEPVTGIEYAGDRDLESPLTTATTVAVLDNGKEVPGTWTFTGWKQTTDWTADDVTDQTNIRENRTVYGKWTFEPEKTNVKVTKVWDDDSNRREVRPETIKVNLIADGNTRKPAATKTITGGATEASWTTTFENVEKYTTSGDLIVYTVEEDGDIPFYETTIPEDAQKQYEFTIVNEIDKILLGKVDVTGTKQWEDNDNQDGKRDNHITVRLFADGEQIDITEASEDTDWAWAFKDLDEAKVVNGEIKTIEYTVEEDAVAEYESDKVVNAETGEITLINTHTPEKTEVSFVKIWEDENNKYDKRPSSITVNLLADGVQVKSMRATKADSYSGKFTDLDMYKNGQKIVYTIEEEAVDNYDSEIANVVSETGETNEYAFEITNTSNYEPPQPGPKTGDNTPIGAFAAAAIAALAGIAVVTRRRKEN